MGLIWQYATLTIIVLIGNYLVRAGEKSLLKRRKNRRPTPQPISLFLWLTMPIFLLMLYGFFTSQGRYTRIVLLAYGLSAVFLYTTAKRLPEHRFRWTLYGLAITLISLAIAQIHSPTIWQTVALLFAAGGILLSGLNAHVVYPNPRRKNDYFYMILVFVAGLYAFVAQARLVGTRVDPSWIATAWIVGGVYIGLMFLVPVWRNFLSSRYGIAWTLLAVTVGLTPWLQRFGVHLPIASLWLLGTAVYWLTLLYSQTPYVPKEDLLKGDRAKLIGAVNFFISAVHDRYESLFGRSQLERIHSQIHTIAPIERTSIVSSMVDYCRDILNVSNANLRDLGSETLLSGISANILHSMGRDEANLLRRTVFKEPTFVPETADIDPTPIKRPHTDPTNNEDLPPKDTERDNWLNLLRQANLLRDFDRPIFRAMINIAEPLSMYAGTVMAEAGNDAQNFVMIESGNVMVRRDGRHLHTISNGDYFGGQALLNSGDYKNTYMALTDVKGFSVPRDRFEQVLHANPALALPLIAGAEQRRMLRDVPILQDLNWQTLTAIEPEQRRLPTESVIIRMGQPQHQLIVVRQGSVEAISRDETGNHVVGIYITGEFFGLDDELAPATFRTTEPTELLLISKSQLPETADLPTQLFSKTNV